MGSPSGGNTGGGGGSPTQMVKNKQKEKFKKTDKFGYPIKTNTFQKIADKSVLYNVLKNNPLSKHTEKVNRKFYDEKVKPAGKSKAPDYETYMKDRLAGKTDAYGNTINKELGKGDINKYLIKDDPIKAGIFPGESNGEKIVIPPPTTSEDTIETRKKKTKAQGRSRSIMTSAKGVTKTSSDYSLGKPSLLGQV